MSTSHIQKLRAMLREEKGVILPGAPNALAARIIADLGFKAVYLTGAGLTNMQLGLPDLGFMDLSQVAEHVMAIRRARMDNGRRARQRAQGISYDTHALGRDGHFSLNLENGGGLATSAAVALVRPVELRQVRKRRAQVIHNAIEHHPQELVSRELAVVL
jgi:hypothetical protein